MTFGNAFRPVRHANVMNSNPSSNRKSKFHPFHIQLYIAYFHWIYPLMVWFTSFARIIFSTCSLILVHWLRKKKMSKLHNLVSISFIIAFKFHWTKQSMWHVLIKISMWVYRAQSDRPLFGIPLVEFGNEIHISMLLQRVSKIRHCEWIVFIELTLTCDD